MKALDRKLVRDLWHLRGQAATIALVVACGIGAFVAQLTTYESLRGSRAAYYETARFAQVFAPVKRAPDPVAGRIAELPGVAEAEATVVADVLLDLPGVAEPVSGRMIGVEGAGGPRLNRLYLRQGRLPEAGRGDEALASEDDLSKAGVGARQGNEGH